MLQTESEYPAAIACVSLRVWWTWQIPLVLFLSSAASILGMDPMTSCIHVCA